MEVDHLHNHIEALIFCSTEAVTADDIHNCLEEMFQTEIAFETIQEALLVVVNKYQSDAFPFEILAMADGYQFLTKPAYQPSISLLLKQKSKKKLSTSALETLAIIAYKQPVIKSEIEKIRGVSCDYALTKLLDKELVEVKGKSDGVGKPVLYGTSDKFMEYFELNSIKDLPVPKDFEVKNNNEIGEVNEI